MNNYLFSYGTLQKEQVQLELFGRKLTGHTDTLKGYRVAPVEISDERFLAKGEDKNQQTVVVSENNENLIKGMVFELTPQELLLADTYEPEGYKRISVMLGSGKAAWIYVFVEGD